MAIKDQFMGNHGRLTVLASDRSWTTCLQIFLRRFLQRIRKQPVYVKVYHTRIFYKL
uniref:Uncharacterized protein n=1 Tax=Oryza sativa subsp. japonica TaxID=39947 RepID=Q654F2_ORYSJ|nr:hypothetical protein [Oryza sativa Japonica Group]BAD61676.1 hypothetical protein [Oryza sativa Japonica Group]